MDKHTDTFTQGNIVELVNHAMVRPSYLSFHNACIVVGRLANMQAREVIRMYRNDKITDALIEESMRVPMFKANKPNNGTMMIF